MKRDQNIAPNADEQARIDAQIEEVDLESLQDILGGNGASANYTPVQTSNVDWQ